MKSFTSLLYYYMGHRGTRRNLGALARFVVVLVLLVTLCSVIFHMLMLREGREYSWVTGFYWTLTVMSTLGFGDITFHSDLGRAFSVVVLLTGVLFLLVLLPFTFIEFFYQPWMEAQKAASVPTRVAEDMAGHVLLTNYGPIERVLIQRLDQYDYTYVVLAADADDAQRMHADGVNVVIGPLDNPETYDNARADAAETPLVGKTLIESNIRNLANINVVGVWERGLFESARPDTEVDENDVVLLAGSQQQLDTFEGLCERKARSSNLAIIVGGGRVGRAVATLMGELGMNWKLVESDRQRIGDRENYIVGDATEPKVLLEAGLVEASTIIITTRDDDINIYLAIFCRKARPDIQIICRSSIDRNVATMHRVGCNFVLSYASMGANAIFNLLKRSDVLMVAEGLDVFRMALPESLVGRTLAESDIRQATGCNVIGLGRNNILSINPEPTTVLETGMEIVVIGTVEAENRFLQKFS